MSPVCIATPVSNGNFYKFTGKERDPETGLDYFGARYYQSRNGRFMTPDWDAKPITVAYANFSNPQSLNLYSYVLNNPTTTRDLDGHFGYSEGGAISRACNEDVRGCQGGGGPDQDVSLGGTTPQPTGREYVAAAQPDERLKPYDDGPQQNQSGQTGSNNNNEQQREGTQRALVISRTSQVLSEKGVQFNGNIDESLSTKCDLGGGNCAFKILNDKLREAVNKALGTPKDSLGAHTGSENRDHNFYMSLHHNNDSLHIDHFNAYRIFPIGAALHGLSDVIIGTLFYGSRTAFAY